MENIYIAYHEKDKASAETIYKQLESDDQKPFMRKNLVAGVLTDINTEKMIDNAILALVLISKNTDKDDGSYFWKEYNQIVHRSKGFRKDSIFIIPIKLDNINLPYGITELKHIDFKHEDWYKELQISIGTKTSQKDYSNEKVKEIKKNTKGAFDDYMKYFTAYDKSDLKEPSIEYFYAAGLHAFHLKDYDLAIFLLLHTKSKELVDSEIYSKLGACYFKRGRLPDALQALTDGIELAEKEKYPTTFYNLGIVHNLKGNTDEAIKAYEAAIKIKPDYYQAVVNLANVLKRKKDFTGAISLLDTFIEKYKGNNGGGISYYNLACIYAANKNWVEAIDTLKVAFELEDWLIKAAIEDEDEDFSDLKVGEYAPKFWNMTFKPQKGSPFDHYMEKILDGEKDSKSYFDLACLASTYSADDAFKFLRLSIQLNRGIVGEIIKTKELDALKKRPCSVKFWNLLRGDN